MAGVTSRPRLLFLCQTLPYPPDGGVWIRTYNVLRLLAQAFDITALCFERAGTSATNTRQVSASRAALSRFAAIEAFAIPQRHSRLRYVWDHVRSTAFGRVYTTYLYDSRAFRRRLAHVLSSTTFDLVHVDSLDLAQYLPACQDLPVVCVHHDVESDLLRRRGTIERGPWRRAYLRYQSRLMEHVERRWCEEIALNVTVSDRDRESVKRLAPRSRVVIVPNGVDVDEFRPDGTPGTGVAYVGGTTPAPNLDALNFFCERILPHLRATAQQPRTRWIGRASIEQQRLYREQFGVELTGYVEDVRPLMREAACHIVPLQCGGGTRLKILNSWAMGRTVVSTSVGCEGLAAVDGENILVRDDPAAFAEATLRVLADDALRGRLEMGGRATAERLYGWDAIGRKMIDTYLSVANVQSRRLAPAADLAECAAHR